MPAHVPRRVFARSFVVTIAALPACGADRPLPQNPPPPETAPLPPAPSASGNASAATSAAPAASASAASAAPEAAKPSAAKPGDQGQSWIVSRDGTKCRAMADVKCPPGDSCNPPPPSDYACPKEIPTTIASFTIVRAAGTQVCEAHAQEIFHETGCPAGAHCNPPPPRRIVAQVPCPK